MSQTQRLVPIVTLVGAYVMGNRALRPLRTMPVMVLSNGRDALSGSPLSDFLTSRCGIFGVATRRVACAGPGAFEGAGREVDGRLPRVPSSTSLACLTPNG